MNWTQRKAIEFDAKSLQILNNPGVYMFVGNDRAIYIGSSDMVIGRALARNHHKRQQIKGLLSHASPLIFPCDTAAEAQQLEKDLTAELQPIFNRRNLLPVDQLATALGITVFRARQLSKDLLCQPTLSE